MSDKQAWHEPAIIAEANPSLIKAAPALLEACKALVSALNAEGDRPETSEAVQHAYQQAQAAIAKAEGVGNSA